MDTPQALMMCEYAIVALIVATAGFHGCRDQKRSGRPRQSGWAVGRWLPTIDSCGFCQRVVCGSGSIAVCAGVALLINITVAAIRWPAPAIHDEFSYLLAADTYALGRLANPPHPFWTHFESMHILQQPAYASKYPPAQGILLAAGLLVTGEPLAGVWLSTALAAAAACWMLRGWLPAEWAFWGGLMTALHTGLQLHWGQSLMGGAPALIGAALLYGAYGRWRCQQSRTAVMVGSAGLAVLANSRPFEGLLVSIPVAAAILWTIVQQDSRRRKLAAVSTLLPAVLILGFTAAWMGFSNRQVTGHFLSMPYSLHSRTYMSGPLFLWQSPPSPRPEYRHDVMRRFHTEWETDAWQAQQNLPSFLKVKMQYYSTAFFFFVSPTLSLAVAWGVRAAWLQRQGDRLMVVCALGLHIAGSAGSVWVFPHYLSPGFPLLLLLAVSGARDFHQSRGNHGDSARFLVPVLAAVYALTFVVSLISYCSQGREGWQYDRERIVADLAQQPGDDVVIVSYDANHSPHEEWVYNRADIDRASVVWARDEGPEENSRLLLYFADRHAWRLEADSRPPRLVAFPAPRNTDGF